MIHSSKQAIESRSDMWFCRNSSGRSQIPQVQCNDAYGISQHSSSGLHRPQFSQYPLAKHVMNQPPQVIKDEVELEAFSCDLLNYGFPLKDCEFQRHPQA
jgi:hypothetical protein